MFESITEGENGKMEGVHRACMDTWPQYEMIQALILRL